MNFTVSFSLLNFSFSDEFNGFVVGFVEFVELSFENGGYNVVLLRPISQCGI